MKAEPTERDWLEGLRYEDKFPEVICDRCGWELGTKAGCPNCYPPDGDPADARA